MRNDELGMYNLFVDVYAQLKDKTVLQVSMGVGKKRYKKTGRRLSQNLRKR